MSENFTIMEMLIQYLDGELTGDQVTHLEERIALDPPLRQQLESLRYARRSVQVYGLRQQVRAIREEMIPHGRYAKLLTWTSRVAAVVVVALGLALLYQYITVSSDRLYRDSYHSFTLRGTRGGGGASAIRQAYTEGRMDEVTRQFEQLSHPAVGDYFLAGNAFLSEGRPGDAIRCLLEAQQLNSAQQTHFFEEDISYYLGMSYLKNGQIARALPIFKRIHDDPENAYHDKVGSWFLRKLRWLDKGK